MNVYKKKSTIIKNAISTKQYRAMLSESEEAVLLAGWLANQQKLGKILLYSHIPHETYTTSYMAKVRNKRAGVQKGVPDYIVVTDKHVLFIELKRLKGGHLSTEQQEWLVHLKGKTTESTLALGFENAKRFIEEYI